ncbi:uncharacterized protein LOC134278759, partial [Saccostrea cucullata]|uniref:uncharacterized protein LOC134278759 n=1 Tax=Saccostrea cuccullata TaxID=36930 RepID=UPI002ED0417E
MKNGSVFYDRQDSGYPESPIILEAHHIRRNYKFLKREMEPDSIVDYLVQHNILDTDEDKNLIGKPRRIKCDFILRKLLQHPRHLPEFTRMIKHYHREEEGFHCFLSLSRSEALAGETSHNAEEVIKSTRLDGTLNKHRNELLEEIKFRISDETESIVDDFLEKDIVSVYEHEEISADTNKSNAAHLLLNCIKNKLPHSYLAMLSVLKTYGAHDLAGRLEAIDDNDFEQTEREFTATWKMLDGELHLTSKVPFEELGVLEVKFTKVEGGIERAVILAIKDAEVTVAQRTHSTYYKTSTGSIIIVLQTESCYAMAKLRQFIETEGISKFLSQIFESSYVRKLLTKEKYEIDVQIREVKERKDPNLDSLQSTEHKKLENTYKSRLDRCHIFLVEELQPRCLLKEKEVADIFSPVLEKMREPSLRRAKVEFFLEHLKKQPEEKIKLVLDKLQEKNKYIYEQLFPDTAKYRDTDIEQVKGNILDSLPNLLDVVNIRAIQTPLLSEGIISPEQLDFIHTNSGSLRNKTLQFVKLVLHRGTEAIKIFLSALEISCGESIVENLLQQRANIQMTSATEERHAKIEYKAFNEEDGLLFKGRFLL